MNNKCKGEMKQILRQNKYYVHLDGNLFNIQLFDAVDIKTKKQIRCGDFTINILNKGFYLSDAERRLGILSSDEFPKSEYPEEYALNAKSKVYETITSMPADILFNYFHYYSETMQDVGYNLSQRHIKNALGI